MTQQDRTEIAKLIARQVNVKMLLGFIGSTVMVIAGVVWTGATYYYNNKADIKQVRDDCHTENVLQDMKIQANVNRIDRVEAFVFPTSKQ